MDEGRAQGLADVLMTVAASPGQTRQLHEILGGFCHQARNLLNCMKMGLYLARRDAGSAGWDDIAGHYKAVEDLWERVQFLARPVPIRRVTMPLSFLFDDRAADWNESLSRCGKRFVPAPPVEPAFGTFDPIRLAEAFDALVSWRAERGNPSTDLRASWGVADGTCFVRWDEPNRKGTRSRPEVELGEPSAYSSLALPILAKVASLHGGRIAATSRRAWRIELRWPCHSGVDPSGPLSGP